VHVPSEAARRAVAYLAADAEVEGVDLEAVDLHVTEAAGFHRLRLPNGRVVEGTMPHIVERLYRVLGREVTSTYGPRPLVHGASILIQGRRFLVVGNKTAGKTTLALHLLARGHLVEGDEHLLIGAANVIARPRALGVRATSFSLVRDLPANVWQAPTMKVWDGTLLYAVSPTLAGASWIIREGPLHRIIFLEPNHGGRSVVAPVGAEESFRRLMTNAYLPDGAISLGVARLRRLALETPAYELRNGDLDGAEWHLVLHARS
jgi:hypothetical protein